MKPYKDVQNDRIEYHRDGLLNTVHRSSLYVPEIKGATAEISLLNHFLIKRGYDRIGCRITGIDGNGLRTESRLLPIDEPRVYTLRPAEVLHETTEATGYLVEFFSSENLYIPFSAVMVNHVGADFLNEVHSYNRVLNDVFEDDAIRKYHVREASIDVSLRRDRETVFFFTSGIQRCEGGLTFDLTIDGENHRQTVSLSQPRLTTRQIGIRDVFPHLDGKEGGILRVTQPEQFLFYGRLLTGQRTQAGQFSANHSYYDLNDFEEYWDDAREASHIYPYFRDLNNLVRIYPIMTPGTLDLSVMTFDGKGQRQFSESIGRLTSPGQRYIDVSVNDLVAQSLQSGDNTISFALVAKPVDTNTPTRINHQLVYSAGGLESSINTSLFSSAVFAQKGKRGFRWGQAPIGRNYRSFVGFGGRAVGGPDARIDVDYYDETGLVARRHYDVPGNAVHIVDVAKELRGGVALPDDGRLANVWYKVESDRSDLGAFATVLNEKTRHCTGEHAF